MAYFQRLLFSAVVALAPFHFASAETGSIMKPAPKAALCNASDLNYPGSLPEYLSINQDYAKSYQSANSDFYNYYAAYLTSLTSRALLSDKYRSRLIEELVSVATVKPIKWPPNDDAPHYFELLVLMPYTVAYAHSKAFMDDSQRDVVESWIKSRIKLVSEGLPSQRTNNRVYHYGAVLAAFGYATGDKSYSKKAYGIFTTAINRQRGDGSLLQDSERGGSALHYTNQAIGNLIAIAEILGTSGYDAYGYSKGNRSIHTIIQFLLAAGSNPKLIEEYAGANPEYSKFQFPGSSPDNQDMGWKKFDTISWAYFYMSRFPDHPNTKALLAISPFLRSGKIGTPDIATGNARCYLGQ